MRTIIQLLNALACAVPKLSSSISEISEERMAVLWRFYGLQEPYISRNIQLSDTKASLLTVALFAAISMLVHDHAFRATLASLFDPSTGLLIKAHTHIGLSAVVAGAALITTGTGICFVFAAVIPRSPHRPKINSAVSGIQRARLVSWVDIATHEDPAVYADLVVADPEEVLLRDALSHLAVLSHVCRQKMIALIYGFWAGGAALVLSIVWLGLFGSGG